MTKHTTRPLITYLGRPATSSARLATSSLPAMASNKRLALSRDQRSVLEAVYAVEKLPDAALRERLSKYLDLDT